MKIIWQGTDSLYLVKFPKQLKWTKIFYIIALRVFAKLGDIITAEHLCCGPLVKKNLVKFGMKKPLIDYASPIHIPQMQKTIHSTFNILYYKINKTRMQQWLYGYDIYLQIKKYYRNEIDINFIEVDGSFHMGNIYPITDLYIRPNRHDGNPRMKREAETYGISTICTLENPDINYFLEHISLKYKLWRKNK
jgi:hypothetical protein